MNLVGQSLNRMSQAYADGPLPAFLDWWRSELVACLPAAWRPLLAGGREIRLLEVEAGQLRVYGRRGQDTRTLGEFQLEGLAEDAKRRLGNLLHNEDGERLQTFLVLPAAALLHRRLTLPKAAGDNLGQVLSFEMDRQTPFKSDQVYFDYRSRLRDGKREIDVDLQVVPRALADASLKTLAALEIAIDGIDAWRGPERQALYGSNLLPSGRRVGRVRRRLRLNLLLTAILIGLIGLVMVQMLGRGEARLEALEARVHQVRIEAQQVVALRQELEEALRAASFLADRRVAEPRTIDVLAEVTNLLPDDIFLERLQISSGSVTLGGEASEAARIISLLQNAQYLFQPGLQGAVQLNPRTGKERFNLTAQLRNAPAVTPDPSGEPDAVAAGTR